MRILVLSTFDVWPPRDGGQNRYVSLWRSFPSEHEITILAYDFRNLSGERRYRLADHVEVIVPLASEGDARHFYNLLGRTGLWLHDVLCLKDYQFSTEFIQRLGSEVSRCDVLVASHPYLAELAFPLAKDRVTRVYEGHNVEFDIKMDYFRVGRDTVVCQSLLAAVKRGESFAARYANIVTTVSKSDQKRLAELYSLKNKAMSIVPNGANIRLSDLLELEQRQEVRTALGLPDGLIGIFLGSSFAANVESYMRGRILLEAAGFRGTMLLVGSIGEADRGSWPSVGFDERWLGFVSAAVRDVLLGAADFALHLMFAGAGTNLKLFDYMGAGVPIIANTFGRRGVDETGWSLPADTESELADSLEALGEKPDEVRQISTRARNLAAERFDWRSIARGFEKDIMAARAGSS